MVNSNKSELSGNNKYIFNPEADCPVPLPQAWDMKLHSSERLFSFPRVQRLPPAACRDGIHVV